MKSSIRVSMVISSVFILFFSLSLFYPKSSNAFAETCKWEQQDCPGFGTGDREVCLVSGDGNSCLCGTVTRECEKIN